MAERKFEDARKYEVGDVLEFDNGEGETVEGKVHGVRYGADVDGIRHTYEYLMDIGNIVEGTEVKDEKGKVIGGQPDTVTINSSHVVKLVKAVKPA